MEFEPIARFVQKRLPLALAVYAFGSRVVDQGQHASPHSDLDLAVLVEGYADPITLFELSGELADMVGYSVDLLDLRAASTVMQHQVLTCGQRLWAKDVRAGLFEAAMLTEKLHLNEMRQGLVEDIQARGFVYGR
jgi:predicted nucleotidyltransferase